VLFQFLAKTTNNWLLLAIGVFSTGFSAKATAVSQAIENISVIFDKNLMIYS
jgi:hypothetical protein